MSSKELKRLGVLAHVEKEALNLIHAAEILGLSYRQAKRIWRRYREEGAEGLQHRSVGRLSPVVIGHKRFDVSNFLKTLVKASSACG
jgi:transposase